LAGWRLGGNLSRIWEALRAAHRAKTGITTDEPPPEDFDRRKILRRARKVPLLVYGSGPDRQPFHETAESMDVSENGCLVMLQSTVTPGQKLLLMNSRNQAEHECRVAYVGKRENGRARVGLAFAKPSLQFWESA
jgi:hypothetical protein